jgi:membrane fusion protein, multidrug efflux system
MTDDGKTAPVRKLILPLVILVIVAALILGGIYAWQQFVAKHFIAPQLKAMAGAPQTVSTIIAASTSWHTYTEALGSVRATRGADLAANTSGVVDKISIESGTDVPAGTVLMTLRPYDDPAKLAQLQAAAELAAITLKRDQEQLTAQAIPQATVDTDVSNLKSARAQVVQQQELIKEKTVLAPFAGSLGIRQVDEGQFLAAGTTVVTLQALDPIFIDFYIPQETLNHVKVGQAVSATVDAYPGKAFKGKITALNSKVDPASRNVQARGSFTNAGHELVPGMYATVEVENGDAVEHLTLPQSAITYNPYGNIVYVVQKSSTDDKGNKKDAKGDQKLNVQQRFVKLGDTRGDQVAVLSGVKAGEEIVTAGQMKLRNGSPVAVNNTVPPTNEPNPTPPNE